MHKSAHVIGIDIGTTAIKGALFDPAGACLCQKKITYPTVRRSRTEIEQDPNDWLKATEQIIEEVAGPVSVDEIAGVCICGQTNTHVFVDADGRPLFPAITWQDTRCEPQARRLDRQLANSQRRASGETGGHIAASHTVSRMAWMAESHPEIWERVTCVLSPKDYVLLHLTGQRVSDALSCFDLVDLAGEYVAELMALVPGGRDLLPPLREFTTPAGAYGRGALKEARVPVMTGTMDGLASMFGTGVAAAGEGAYLSGTSEIIALASDRRVHVPGVVSFLPVNGLQVHAGPTQSGGDSLRWFANVVARPMEEVLGLAAGIERKHAKVLFLPHLQGERAPLWDSDSRGAFLGLTAKTDAADLALGVLEGVALSAKLLFDEVVKAAGRDYGWLYMAGGGSESDLWCQIRADVFGIELRRAAFLDAGVMGAAIIAAVGAGLYPSLQEAARNMTRVDKVFRPDGLYANRYAEALRLYKTAYQNLRDINRHLR